MAMNYRYTSYIVKYSLIVKGSPIASYFSDHTKKWKQWIIVCTKSDKKLIIHKKTYHFWICINSNFCTDSLQTDVHPDQYVPDQYIVLSVVRVNYYRQFQVTWQFHVTWYVTWYGSITTPMKYIYQRLVTWPWNVNTVIWRFIVATAYDNINRHMLVV